MMKAKSYSVCSSSSSDDEALIVLKQEKYLNDYRSLRIQTSEQCEFCDEEFTDRYTLLQHNISHMVVPVVKLNIYQCKECQRQFDSTDDLDTHMLNYHNKLIIKPNVNKNSNNVKGKVPEILKCIVEKKLLVKCNDDINLLVNTNLSPNGDKAWSDRHIGYSDNKRSSDGTQRAPENDTKIRNDLRNIDNGGIPNKDGKTVKDGAMKSDSKIYNDGFKNTYDEDIVKREPSLVKDELFSPTTVRERDSSPLEDEKESIRHRLLFEEDVEDTLFRGISDECHVNIDTLCQEVSFDVDDASEDSWDSTGIYCNRKKGFSEEVNNSVNQMSIHNSLWGHNIDNVEENNYENGSDFAEADNGNETGFERGNDLVVIENGTNNFGYGVNNSESAMNNSESVMNNSESVMNNSDNGTGEFKMYGSHSINVEAINVIENDKVAKNAEQEYRNSIHYDDLTIPNIWNCKLCGKQFFSRFQLLQHKVVHLQIKKPHISSPLCCLCDRYIAGNHYTLKNHIANQHPEYVEKINYSTKYCPKCGLKYYNYSKHLKNYHEAYKCDVCAHRFETFRQLNAHICGESSDCLKSTLINSRSDTQTVMTDDFYMMQLCDLCFSFMKIYMQNRQRVYEEVGTKSEMGVRLTCDKCSKEFFSVRLVKRRSWKVVGVAKSGSMESQKASEVSQMALDGLKAADFGIKTGGIGQKVDKKVELKPKIRSKPLSNKERLVKIQNRLKMMKKINKC